MAKTGETRFAWTPIPKRSSLTHTFTKKPGAMRLSFWLYRDAIKFPTHPTWALVGQEMAEMVVMKHLLARHLDFESAFNVDGHLKRFSLIESG